MISRPDRLSMWGELTQPGTFLDDYDCIIRTTPEEGRSIPACLLYHSVCNVWTNTDDRLAAISRYLPLSTLIHCRQAPEVACLSVGHGSFLSPPCYTCTYVFKCAEARVSGTSFDIICPNKNFNIGLEFVREIMEGCVRFALAMPFCQLCIVGKFRQPFIHISGVLKLVRRVPSKLANY